MCPSFRYQKKLIWNSWFLRKDDNKQASFNGYFYATRLEPQPMQTSSKKPKIVDLSELPTNVLDL